MRGFLALLAAAALVGGSGCEDRSFVCPAIYTLTVTISPAAASVPVGGTARFSATPGGGRGGCGSPFSPATRKVTWSVSNSAVATITSWTDTTVVVMGASDGITTVIATSVDDSNVKSAGMLTVGTPVGGRAP